LRSAPVDRRDVVDDLRDEPLDESARALTAPDVIGADVRAIDNSQATGEPSPREPAAERTAWR